MKLLASTMLLGAAAAVAGPQQQHVFKNSAKEASEAWTNSVEKITETLKAFTDNPSRAWDDTAVQAAKAIKKMRSVPAKPHTRRPDHQWDFITKGAAAKRGSKLNARGLPEQELDGKLDTYNLRTRKVDPAKLGVDPDVKQYSGYLDDEEADKHLFYCQWSSHDTSLLPSSN